jgi:subtilisin family serine protease
MARYEHLQLIRVQEPFPRRKGRPGPPPKRDAAAHSAQLSNELDQAIEVIRRRRPAHVDPSLILRVKMGGGSHEAEWEQLGLTVLSIDPDRTLIVFSSSDEMAAFRERLGAFAKGVQPGKKNPAYAGFVANLESIGTVEPRDRIGWRLRSEGLVDAADFLSDATYVIDVELWDVGSRALRDEKLRQIAAAVADSGGEVLDEYIGPSITMLRVSAPGTVIRTLLDIDVIAEIDLPPRPDLATADAIRTELPELPPVNALPENAPLIGVIDSGVNAHPLLSDILTAAIGVPATLGTADEWGHGTRVGGVAVFGDLRAQLANGSLIRGARLCSAKVVNESGKFDDRRMVPGQMREAVTALRQQFGCRIFVIALADSHCPYEGEKVGTWAATLDELVRELDVVIIVAAGNRPPRGGDRLEEAVTGYPDYLLEPANRLFEPAGAVNVVTVGALAHGEGIDGHLAGDVRVRPITRAGQPSPFTRIGPGAGGAMKPDLVDVGGTMVYDPVVRRLRGGEDLFSAGVLTLHHRPVDRLFTAGSGTSYAAPLVAFKASQILALFPNASANLIRALLAGAADIPQQTQERLQHLGEKDVRAVCGYGQADMERAAYSDDHRVVLYAEDALAIDHFAVYRVPIPEPFQEAGRRTIRVTLAFDPPVRHTRKDYTGIGMSYRLIRGCDPAFIFEHYRKRAKNEGKYPDLPGSYNCPLLPTSTVREKGTLQGSFVSFVNSTRRYGDSYYLVVRCAGGWASEAVRSQRFAVVVEIFHQAQVRLYQRVRQTLKV